ncbi:MAG TPA: DnaJ domain-containing protein [Blastocatellia bacterium]|nr:DnaJ domain-containing protein [Blastocatellia bacterium]
MTIIKFEVTMAKFDATKDYYRELGINEDATKEEIERAYRAEARKRHPDGGGSEEDMKSLNEARDVLGDPETRRAYDSERAPKQIPLGSSAAFDPEAASRQGTLKIPVKDEDFAGLMLGAAACFGLGLPLLLLVEMQWVFFLWPLRFLSFGALVLGVLMSHSALKVKHRRWRKENPDYNRSLFVIHEAVFWLVMIFFLTSVVAMLYFI